MGQIAERAALLAEQVLHRHLDVREGQFGGVRAAQTDLLELAADRVAGGGGVHAEDGEPGPAVVRVVRRGAADHQDEVGEHTAGDEGLGAVEDVVGAVLGESGGGGDAGEVGAGARLGHRDRGHDVAGDEAGQPAGLLLLVGVLQQIGQHQAGVHARGPEADAGPRGLLGHHRLVLEAALARAAVLLRHLDAVDAERAQRAVEVARRMARRLPVLVHGDDLVGDEVADGLAEGLVVLGEHGAAHGGAPFDVPGTARPGGPPMAPQVNRG